MGGSELCFVVIDPRADVFVECERFEFVLMRVVEYWFTDFACC